MKYCVLCAGDLTLRVPDEDDRPRHVCTKCGHVHYENPRLIVGCLPVWDGKVLLCKRAIEPRKRYWTLPSGFMENGETIEEGALRETWEESGAHAEIVRLHSVFSLPHVNQVYCLYLARCVKPDLDPGPESEAAGFYAPDDIPWSEIAFRSVEFCLERWVEDPDSTAVHHGSYEREQGGPWILHGADERE